METINVKITEIIPNIKNPRKITQHELKKLMRSIQEFGFVEPVILNKNKDRYNIVIGGHQRIQAAKKLGHKEVPCVYVDLPEANEHLLNVALNEISGDWDDQKLFDLLKDLQEKGADLTLTGFDEPIIDEIMASNLEREKEELIDVAPVLPEKPKTKQGEIYKMGNHRLMCGNSTKESDMAKLMNGKVADMSWTDPLYGVSYKGTNNPNGRAWELLKNDELRGDELSIFLKGIYDNVFKFTKEGAALYSCYASINHRIFEQTLNEAGWIVKQLLIWEKGHVLGHSDYHWCHEPILYCKRGEQNTTWYGDRTQKTYILNSTIEQLEDLTKDKLVEIISNIRKDSDIIHLRKDPSNQYLHSTQKPVELSKIMIKNSSRPTELILEPCCGSGSTLMACETSSRKCYAMELDPKYCDVILTRWAGFTGKEPIRESDGKKWGEIKKE